MTSMMVSLQYLDPAAVFAWGNTEYQWGLALWIINAIYPQIGQQTLNQTADANNVQANRAFKYPPYRAK